MTIDQLFWYSVLALFLLFCTFAYVQGWLMASGWWCRKYDHKKRYEHRKCYVKGKGWNSVIATLETRQIKCEHCDASLSEREDYEKESFTSCSMPSEYWTAVRKTGEKHLKTWWGEYVQ